MSHCRCGLVVTLRYYRDMQSPQHRSIRFLAVDGFNLIRRIYEARHIQSAADMPQVVEAAAASLTRGLKEYQPTHVAVVLEDHDKTWRHLLYPEYKANRSETPSLLLEGLPAFREAFANIGVASFSIPNYEADDVIATLASTISARQGEVIVLSTDKIYLQLLPEGVGVVDHFRDTRLTSDYVQERFGVSSQQLVDYFTLVGDSSNNIKGVVGIGPKSAVNLLEAHGSVDGIMNADSDDRLVLKVQDAAVEVDRTRQLVTLKRDVELGVNLKSFRRIS